MRECRQRAKNRKIQCGHNTKVHVEQHQLETRVCAPDCLEPLFTCTASNWTPLRAQWISTSVSGGHQVGTMTWSLCRPACMGLNRLGSSTVSAPLTGSSDNEQPRSIDVNASMGAATTACHGRSVADAIDQVRYVTAGLQLAASKCRQSPK